MKKCNELNFKNQVFFIGIDVHSRQWTVTIRNEHLELKTFSMNPSPHELLKYMKRNYPGGLYKSVYEAGFCGFWIHRRLTELGIENIVVNPADIPTSNKEKDRKRDPVDSRKLARELLKGELEGIYIPDEFHHQLRSLCRLRFQIVQNQTRVKNRIKCHLYNMGKSIPSHTEMSHWSAAFIKHLEDIEFEYLPAGEYIRLCLNELAGHHKRLLEITRSLRKLCNEYDLSETIKLLLTVPGFGFTTAVTFYAELMDIHRFPDFSNLCSYVGLVPSVSSSDKKKIEYGLSMRRNRFLRFLIIEAAWIAVRNDPALLYKFNYLARRMKKQEAIVRIAKKLLRRVRYVWKNEKSYVKGVVE